GGVYGPGGGLALAVGEIRGTLAGGRRDVAATAGRQMRRAAQSKCDRIFGLVSRHDGQRLDFAVAVARHDLDRFASGRARLNGEDIDGPIEFDGAARDRTVAQLARRPRTEIKNQRTRVGLRHGGFSVPNVYRDVRAWHEPLSDAAGKRDWRPERGAAIGPGDDQLRFRRAQAGIVAEIAEPAIAGPRRHSTGEHFFADSLRP